MIGVLIMAYGTPASPDEIEDYYTDIRRGRPPTPEQLADLRQRYEAIGGTSPLLERTRAQVAAVAEALEVLAPGRFVVGLGTRHSSPRIAATAAELASRGATALVGLVLAPHHSVLSIGAYDEQLSSAGESLGLASATIPSWHDLPELIDALAERVRAAAATLAGGAGEGGVEVLFSAHSLPARIIDMGDPYPAELRRTAELVAAAAGVDRWRTAWQSAGRSPEPWLGPDVCEVLPTLPAEGVASVVICPAGFTSDHLEVLYDIDIEAQRVAALCGVTLVRTASINDDRAVCAGLARLVVDAADRLVAGAA